MKTFWICLTQKLLTHSWHKSNLDWSGCQDAKKNPNSIFFRRSKFFPFLALCLFFRCTWNPSKFPETSPVTCFKIFQFIVFSKSVRQENSRSKTSLSSSHFATKVRCLILSLLGLQVAFLWEKKILLSYTAKWIVHLNDIQSIWAE